MEDARVDRGREEIVRGRDGVDVARQVEIEFLHGDDLRAHSALLATAALSEASSRVRFVCSSNRTWTSMETLDTAAADRASLSQRKRLGSLKPLVPPGSAIGERRATKAG